MDATKAKPHEDANKQKENALKAAQAEVDRIRNRAQKLSDKIVSEVQIQGDQLIAKANNPITKKIARISAQKFLEEAKKKAFDLNAKAETEAL